MDAERIVYIKAEKSVMVTHPVVRMEDVFEISAYRSQAQKEIRQMMLYHVETKEKDKIVFSVLKAIEQIRARYPDYQVVNEGETDFIVEYAPPGEKKSWITVLKIAFVCLAVSIGSAFTIMTFDQDVNVKEIFQKIYELTAGLSENPEQVSQSTGLVELFYCIGMPVGIIVFFNHFSKIALSNDPTPLQVQLKIYEKDVNDSIVMEASREGKSHDVT